MKDVISGSEMEPEKRDSERREEQQQQQENQRCSRASAACCSTEEKKTSDMCYLRTYRSLFILGSLISLSLSSQLGPSTNSAATEHLARLVCLCGATPLR